MGVYLYLYFVMALTVFSSNVNGIHDNRKWADVWQDIPKQDIICLQETHLIAYQEYAFCLHAQAYDLFFSHGSSASLGVCIAV